MITTETTFCLAHENDDKPRNPRTPPDWCERRESCMRHQAISLVPRGVTFAVENRMCQPGLHDQYIAKDETESEGCEA